MNLSLLINIIGKMNFNWTINLYDIISVIVTIIIAFYTINRNNKNVNKQLAQQQQNFQEQLETNRNNHTENKNIELRKNQLDFLPIIDIENPICTSNGKKATFKFTLKNIGKGAAHNCYLNTDNNLVVYNDSYNIFNLPLENLCLMLMIHLKHRFQLIDYQINLHIRYVFQLHTKT